MFRRNKISPKNFVIDVDGVFTNGYFFYDKSGKQFKCFGPDDADALSSLKNFLNITTVTADKRGFDISQRRIHEDLGFEIYLVDSESRAKWINDNYDIKSTIYMGDGFYDQFVFAAVAYSIAPANALPHTKKAADFVTKRTGGDRAIAEACIHVAKKFFGISLVG